MKTGCKVYGIRYRANSSASRVLEIEGYMLVSIGTLRKILFAMGAELRIIAHFPDTDVVIDQFADLQKSTNTR